MKFRCAGLTERNTLRSHNANKFIPEIKIIICRRMNIIKIFSDDQHRLALSIMGNERAQMKSLSRPEIKELACVWSYYSGKIEGCTYSYAETEGLLKDGITPAKTWEEAKMLKNLHNAFMYEMQQILENDAHPVLDERYLLSLHGSLANGLLSGEEVAPWRNHPVGVTGANYTPPRSRQEIQQEIARILYEQYLIENPLERAVYLHCNIARTQPFADCNKRTSRLVEAITLMSAGLVPCYSSAPADVIAYHNAIINFYETEDYTLYADYMLEKLANRAEALSW